jgi:hypothetical protein
MIARKIKPTIFRFSMKNSNKNLEIGKKCRFGSSIFYTLKQKNLFPAGYF